MSQCELLKQLEAARVRLNISPVGLRQLAFEAVQGTSWPVRSYADMDSEQLEKLLEVMSELERNEAGRRMQQEELIAR